MTVTEWIISRSPPYPKSVQVTVTGLFAGLIAVLTILIQVPVPATSGFINIGDAGVMLAGLLFGPIIGGVSGGLGSALADVISGYGFYAPWTLLIKGIEGLLVGLVSRRSAFSYLDVVACFIIAGPWMVCGYFMAQSLLFGTAAALVELPLNIVQFSVGGALALPVSIMSRRVLPQINLVKDK